MIKSIKSRRVLIIFVLTLALLTGSAGFRRASNVAKAAPLACSASISVELTPSTFPITAGQLFIPPIELLGTIEVTASDPCWHDFVLDADWVTIISVIVDKNDPPDFNGTINFRVESNTTPERRIAHFIIGDQTFTIFQGGRFIDVPEGFLFFNEIGLLSAHGITKGCSPGLFCAGAPTSRGQMAAFIMRTLGEFDPPAPATQTFADVPPTHPFFAFIERLAALGITVGCGPGIFCPDEDVPREQMAAFIIRALGEFSPPTPATQRFLDVPPTNIYYNFIDRLAALGITNGCSASPALYCPSATITRAEMAAFLVRAFHL